MVQENGNAMNGASSSPYAGCSQWGKALDKVWRESESFECFPSKDVLRGPPVLERVSAPAMVDVPVAQPHNPTKTAAIPQELLGDFRALFLRASELYSASNWADAVAYFHAADRAAPGTADNLVMMANCYQQMGNFSTAVGIYEYATKIDSHNALAWYNQGLTLNRLGRLQESKECQLNALRDRIFTGAPAFDTVASSLSNVLRKLGDNASACRLLQEVVDLKKGRYTNAAMCLADWYSEDGLLGEALEALLSQQPTDFPEWFENSDQPYTLNANFKMQEFLGRLCPPNSFSLPKHPETRNQFEKAIKLAVESIKSKTQDPKVLEMDGLGMLCIFALQSGCSKATCKVRKWESLSKTMMNTFLRHGYPDSVVDVMEYDPSSVAETELQNDPHGAQLVVSAAYAASGVPLLLGRMHKYQAQGITTVPRRGSLKIMAIQSEQLRMQADVGNVSGFNLSSFGGFSDAMRKYCLSVHLSQVPHVLMSGIAELEFPDNVADLWNMKVVLPIIADGQVDAIVSWYDLDLWDGVMLSMGPSEDCVHKQNVQTVPIPGAKVGDTLDLTVCITKWAKDYTQQWIMFDNAHLLKEGQTEPAKAVTTDLSSSDGLQGTLWHFDMMADTKRNEAYDRALGAVVKPDSVVLDIGTGSGLLSLMAARHGAKKVYTIEMNPDIAAKARAVIKDNGYEHVISVISGKSTEVRAGVGHAMPEQVDIIVTETMGTDFLSESMYMTLDDARDRLLKPGGIMIPGKGRVLAQLVQVDSQWHIPGFAGRTSPASKDIDLSLYNRLLPKFWNSCQAAHLKYTPLSEPFSMFNFDFDVPLVTKGLLTAPLNVTISTPGSLHAILIWWDADLGTDDQGNKIIIETGPDSRYAHIDHAHWSQMIQVLSCDGLQVATGEQVPVSVYTDNHLSYAELPQHYIKAKTTGSHNMDIQASN